MAAAHQVISEMNFIELLVRLRLRENDTLSGRSLIVQAKKLESIRSIKTWLKT